MSSPLSVDFTVLYALAGRLDQRAGTVAALAPRLAAGMLTAGVELLPLLGVLEGLAVSAQLAALCGPAGLPGVAAALGVLAAQVRCAGAAYRALDGTMAAARTGWPVTEQLTAPLGAVAMLVAWDAEHRLLPAGLRPAVGRALDTADRFVEGPVQVHELDAGELTGRGIDAGQLVAAAGSARGALGAVATLSTPRSPSTLAVVQTGAGPPGRFVVCLPGLQRWDGTDGGAADLPGAAATLTGHSAYVTGVRRVLAGLPDGSEAVLVGHSQGGMVAQAVAAAGPLHGRGARVGALLTAGSPLLADRPPAGTTQLALENSADPVPALRAVVTGLVLPAIPQQADPDRTVVRFTGPPHGPGLLHHDLRAGGYLDAAASADPRVRAFRATTARFFTGVVRSVRVYQVTDGPRG